MMFDGITPGRITHKCHGVTILPSGGLSKSRGDAVDDCDWGATGDFSSPKEPNGRDGDPGKANDGGAPSAAILGASRRPLIVHAPNPTKSQCSRPLCEKALAFPCLCLGPSAGSLYRLRPPSTSRPRNQGSIITSKRIDLLSTLTNLLEPANSSSRTLSTLSSTPPATSKSASRPFAPTIAWLRMCVALPQSAF